MLNVDQNSHRAGRNNTKARDEPFRAVFAGNANMRTGYSVRQQRLSEGESGLRKGSVGEAFFLSFACKPCKSRFIAIFLSDSGQKRAVIHIAVRRVKQNFICHHTTSFSL